MADVSFKPADTISAEILNIKKAPVSSFEEVISAVYYDSKVFFLCEMHVKKQQPCAGTTIWYDPIVGKFDAIKDQEMVCFGHFGTNLLALASDKLFYLLTNSAWKVASIPSLPADDLQNPVILTYQSLLIIVNGKVVWVHDDSICDWMQFELSVAEGDLDISPKNSFAILAGKLFICISSQETVYSVELQPVIDKILNYPNSKTGQDDPSTQEEETKPKQEDEVIKDALNDALKEDVLDKAPNSTEGKPVPPKQTLQLSRILKGATFIFLHSENLLAFHNTPTCIDRVWYYDVRCYHWHNVEYNNSDASGLMLKNWISLSNCAGVLKLVWSSWSWAQCRAKLYTIQLAKQ